MNRSEARYRVAKALGSKGAAGKHMKRIDKAAAKAMEKEKKIKGGVDYGYSKGGKVAYNDGGKLKVNRRRAKYKDEDGNMVKVKVNKDGSVKKAKYRVSDESKNRQVAISNMGHMHNRVLGRRGEIADKKFAKKVSKSIKRGETSEAYDDMIRRKKKVKNLSKLKNKR